jgi:hypothetical protein
VIPSPAPQAVSSLLFIAFKGCMSYKYKTNEAVQMKKQLSLRPIYTYLLVIKVNKDTGT